MKITTPVNINITLLKSDIDPSVKIQDVKNYLIDAGASVAGYKEDNGDLIMVITGNVEYEDIEEAFNIIAGVDVNNYIFDDDVDYENEIDLFEKKRSCCPKKRTATVSKKTFVNEKKQVQRKPARRVVNENKKHQPLKTKKKNSGNLVNLYEALHGNYRKPNNKNVTLNEVIDDMTGKRLSESVARRAMQKAKQSYIKNKLGEKTYRLVCESLKEGKKSIYPNVKINNKAIVEYTTNELEVLLEKLTSQIAKIQKDIAGLNEADGVRKLHEQLDKKNKIRKILDEEISYRKALALREDDEHKDNDGEEDKFDFKSLNPSDFQTDDNGEGDKEDKSEENKEDDEEEKTSDENPDEDTVEELGSIVITLASKEDAENLKSDCIEAGIPEDVLEVSPVEDEDEEDKEEQESDENEEEGQEKKTEESFGRKYKHRLYEDDENDEEPADDEEGSADEESKEEDADGSYKLTLTDTDELPKFKEVLIDKWGVTEDEFAENIGEIVEDEESDDESEGDDEKSSDDENPDDFDFDPDEIFKDL